MTATPRHAAAPAIPRGRIAWIDSARGWCMLAIVIGHMYLPWNEHPAVFDLLYAFHVPAFFLLSGLTFRAQGVGWTRFLTRRARGLLVPYVLWALASFAVFQVLGSLAATSLGRRGPSRVLHSLLGVLVANPSQGWMDWNKPLWFLPALFLASVVGYVAVRWRYAGPVDLLWVWLLLSVPVSWWFQTHPSVMVPWSADRAAALLPFFLLGIVLRRQLTAAPVRGRLARGAAGVLLLALTACLSHALPAIDYVTEQYPSPGSFAVVTLLGVAGVLLVSQAGAWTWVRWVGRESLGVLVMHKFVVIALQVALSPFLPATSASGWDSLAVIVLGGIVTVICAAVSARLGSLAPWTLGRRRPASASAATRAST